MVKTLPFNKTPPFHTTEGCKELIATSGFIVCSYTGLIFRLSHIFDANNVQTMYLSYTWDLRQATIMEGPPCIGACPWCSEIWKVEGRPWHDSASFAVGQVIVPSVWTDSKVKGSSPVALIFLGVIPQRHWPVHSMSTMPPSTHDPSSRIHLSLFLSSACISPVPRVVIAKNTANHSNNNSCQVLAICSVLVGC